MNKFTDTKLHRALLWVGSYLSIVTLALVAGWTLLKSEDESSKREARLSIVFYLVFLAIHVVLELLSQFCGTIEAGAGADKAFRIIRFLYELVKAIVYCVMLCLAVFGTKKTARNEQIPTPSEHAEISPKTAESNASENRNTSN